MHTLTDWTAKRAGGRITVYGKDDNGQDAKVVGVDRIEGSKPYPVAVDKNGVRYALA